MLGMTWPFSNSNILLNFVYNNGIFSFIFLTTSGTFHMVCKPRFVLLMINIFFPLGILSCCEDELNVHNSCNCTLPVITISYLVTWEVASYFVMVNIILTININITVDDMKVTWEKYCMYNVFIFWLHIWNFVLYLDFTFINVFEALKFYTTSFLRR